MQDGQDAPAPPGTTPSRLQVVLLAFDKDGERKAAKDRYTLIRFPQTYEEAIAAIERNFGAHLPGGKADSMDIFSRMLNDDDEWIWAKADREDWDLVREDLLVTGKALGIGRAAPPPFVRGPILLAHKPRGSLQWGLVGPRDPIERPGSYLEATESILSSVAETYPEYDIDELLKVKFFYFISDQSNGPNTELWVEFPESAYEDDEIWRAFVPKPPQLLGFTLAPK